MNQPVSVLAGVHVAGSDVRVALPVNLEPVPGQEGVTDGYLRPVEGVSSFAVGSGNDRASIVWTGTGNGVHYRVSGTKLVTVSATGTVAVIGDVGGSGHARLDFSFTLLGILSGGKLYYYDGATLTLVTDPNIPANLVDMVWLGGYWIVTDGTNIAVSDLATPTTFNPLKFGGTDRPNPIKFLAKGTEELIAGSENYIDFFRNVGGAGFPFQRVLPAVVTRGAIGTRAACVMDGKVAFLGSGRKEEPGVYFGVNAQSAKISTMEVDAILKSYTTAQLATTTLETQIARGMNRLFVHLSDRSLVYDALMSERAGQAVWHTRVSAIKDYAQLRAQNYVLAYDQWVAGDPASNAIGVTNTERSEHYGNPTRWEFVTPALRAGPNGVTMNRLELLAVTGKTPAGLTPRISVAYSYDGEGYSIPRSIPSGIRGETLKKLEWRKLGTWKRFRVLRFQGDSNSRLSPMALDADLTALQW